jgi:hypothetical protein
MTNLKLSIISIKTDLCNSVMDQRPDFSPVKICPLSTVWNEVYGVYDRLERFCLTKYLEK